MDERFLRLVEELLQNEDATGKGIAHSIPGDLGGLTKWGISQRSYPDLDIANLTRDQAIEIYWRDWWVRYRYGELADDELAEELLDLSPNMGPVWAHMLLQQAARETGGEWIDIDGILGPLSFRAINSHPNARWLVDRFKLLAIRRYLNLNKAQFLTSWVRRAIN